MMYSTYDTGVHGILINGEVFSLELGHLSFWMRDEYGLGDTPSSDLDWRARLLSGR